MDKPNNPSPDRPPHTDSRITLFRQPEEVQASQTVRQQDYIAALCLNGSATFRIEEQEYCITRNQLFVYRPHLTMKATLTSTDFEGRIIQLSSNYAQQLFLIENAYWNVQLFLESNPILSLTDEETEVLCRYYDLLDTLLTLRQPGIHHQETVNAILISYLFEMRNIIDRFLKHENIRFTQGEQIFNKFIHLLTTCSPKRRDVAYYADELCVSPKYLSHICREISGKPALSFISQYVINEIKMKLHNPAVSIKALADEQDFPDISSFGKYFKKRTGLSPRSYRRQWLDEIADRNGKASADR